MPRDLGSSPRSLDIAVIGSGIAGLSAAWLLSHAHRVTVYEQDRRLGGHSHTWSVSGPDGPIPVDAGFIVYNELNYPNLAALFDQLGVATRASNMSFATSIGDGRIEYSGSGLAGLFAQGSNLVRAGFWRMLLDILRFYRTGHLLLSRPDAELLTLSQYLVGEGYSSEFIQHHLLPMAAAIWSSPVDGMGDHPALAFIRFCKTHGLMRIGGRPQWRTVEGGSRCYVERLAACLDGRIRSGSPIVRVRRENNGVTLRDADGHVAEHDHVVIATHADQALAMLADPSYDERRLLGAFTYTRNRAVLHRDPALMPYRRRLWSSWNYISRAIEPRRPRVCVTYWMNSLQHLDPRVPLFVTLNPCREPAPDLIEGIFYYDHPTYHRAAARAQHSLGTLQGVRNTWFCGSYFGAGFHEDALSAGLNVAERLGGVARPWTPPFGANWSLRPPLHSAAE